MRSRRYESSLPNPVPLSPQQLQETLAAFACVNDQNQRNAVLLSIAKLVKQHIGQQLVANYVNLVRKLVSAHLADSHRKDANWTHDLESAAIEALWQGLRRVDPAKLPNPFAFLRCWINGALLRTEQQAGQHWEHHVNTSSLPPAEDQDEYEPEDPKADGRRVERDFMLWDSVEHVGGLFPPAWRVADLIRMASSPDWNWREISNELGVPMSTCEYRYQRGLDELRKIWRD